jgi:zinc protease
VLQTILVSGGWVQTRLGRRIREEQSLVYGLSGGFDTTLYSGPLQVSFGADPRGADRAVRLLEREVRRVRSEGVTQREVDEAVAHLIASVPVQIASNQGMAQALASAAFYGLDPNLPVAAQRRYGSVTRDQVNAAARAHLHPDRATVVVLSPSRAAGGQP